MENGLASAEVEASATIVDTKRGAQRRMGELYAGRGPRVKSAQSLISRQPRVENLTAIVIPNAFT